MPPLTTEILQDRVPAWTRILVRMFDPLEVTITIGEVDRTNGFFELTFKIHSEKNQIVNNITLLNKELSSYGDAHLDTLFRQVMRRFDERLKEIAIQQVIHGELTE